MQYRLLGFPIGLFLHIMKTDKFYVTVDEKYTNLVKFAFHTQVPHRNSNYDASNAESTIRLRGAHTSTVEARQV